jgi:hypothetical protein
MVHILSWGGGGGDASYDNLHVPLYINTAGMHKLC